MTGPAPQRGGVPPQTLTLRDVPPRVAFALEQASVHPLLARLFAARGVRSADDLDDGLARLLPPAQLLGATRAGVLLADALAAQRFRHIDGADIRGQIGALVKIVVDQAEPGDDHPVRIQDHVPLRDAGRVLLASQNTRLVQRQGNAPDRMEPGRRLLSQVQGSVQGDDTQRRAAGLEKLFRTILFRAG